MSEIAVVPSLDFSVLVGWGGAQEFAFLFRERTLRTTTMWPICVYVCHFSVPWRMAVLVLKKQSTNYYLALLSGDVSKLWVQTKDGKCWVMRQCRKLMSLSLPFNKHTDSEWQSDVWVPLKAFLHRSAWMNICLFQKQCNWIIHDNKSLSFEEVTKCHLKSNESNDRTNHIGFSFLKCIFPFWTQALSS
jgi:hypothetical protein